MHDHDTIPAADLAAFEAALTDLIGTDTAPPTADLAAVTERPIAQGDLLAVPARLLPDAHRWVPDALDAIGPTRHTLLGGDTPGAHEHVLTGDHLTIRRGPRTGPTPPEVVAVVHVRGLAVLTHTGHHARHVLGTGTWVFHRQVQPLTPPPASPTPPALREPEPGPTGPKATRRPPITRGDLTWGPVWD